MELDQAFEDALALMAADSPELVEPDYKSFDNFLEDDEQLPDWVTNSDTSGSDSDSSPLPQKLENKRRLIIESYLVLEAEELAVFWIHLTEEDLAVDKMVDCFVRGPSGTRYPVLISRDPLLVQPNQLRCVWHPRESGLHKVVTFVGGEALPESHNTSLILLKNARGGMSSTVLPTDSLTEETEPLENENQTPKRKFRTRPRRLDF